MSLSAPIVEQLAALIQRRTGNLVPPARLGFLGEVAERRAHAVGARTATDYVHSLAAGQLDREWDQLVSLITIKESYFFRAPQQFAVIEQQVLPRLVRARGAVRRLAVWSAACARGEEAATLAMVLAEQAGLAGWEWSILATDIDEEALAVARRGLYGERAVALVPPRLAARYLTRRGKLFELVPEILGRIDYRSHNLARPPYALPSEEYDLVLLRNVLIYFDRVLQSQVVAEIAPRLSPKGLLFLGASETLWQIQDELEAVDLGTCYAYRHRRQRPAAGGGAAATAPPTGLAAAAEPASTVGAAPRPASPAAAAALPGRSGRVAASPGAGGGAAPPAGVSSRRAAGSRSTAVGAQASGSGSVGAGAEASAAAASRSVGAEAAGGAGAAEPAAARSAPELLLAAARELAASRLEGARQAVAEALAADPSEPACHALDGFLHDLGGRDEDAAASYRAALYLDPSLFQPRLLLADCLLRLGQRQRAEHEYRETLAALEGGRARALASFDSLPLPERERALRRCRQALQGG